MATAAAAQRRPGSITRPNPVSIGTIVWLSSELMFFAALFAMYFTTRAVNEPNWPMAPAHLDVVWATPFTIILVLSSVTCQIGVFHAERGDVRGMRRWIFLTFLMGFTFIAGQLVEYFVNNNFTMGTNAYGSVYYLTTGFHGLHVIGGLVAFLMLLGRSYLGPYTPNKATSAIVVSYYWHFVDVVWIGLYTVIYLIH